jgi:hypothetical protein
MTPQEAALVLAKISTLDSRINAASPETARARAEAWAEVLDRSMTMEWAIAHVLDHYRTKRDVVMPADLNVAWRGERDRQLGSMTMLALDSVPGVPMPESVKRLWLEILDK